MRWPPTCSQDVAEAREIDQANAHDPDCQDGWIGGFDLDHPVPCPVHKPHLVGRRRAS